MQRVHEAAGSCRPGRPGLGTQVNTTPDAELLTTGPGQRQTIRPHGAGRADGLGRARGLTGQREEQVRVSAPARGPIRQAPDGQKSWSYGRGGPASGTRS